MIVYPDTNVIINLLDQRDSGRRPTATFAYEFFKRGLQCAFSLVRSDHLDFELGRHADDERVVEFWERFAEKDKVVQVETAATLRRKSRSFAHPDDALHALLAEKAGASYLATYNWKHFTDCQDLVSVRLPEMI